MSIRNLDQLFDPTSVRLFGASQRFATVSASVCSAGFAGPRYAVNPKLREIDGQTLFARGAALSSVSELAVICTPPATVVGLIDHLGTLGTRTALADSLVRRTCMPKLLRDFRDTSAIDPDLHAVLAVVWQLQVGPRARQRRALTVSAENRRGRGQELAFLKNSTARTGGIYEIGLAPQPAATGTDVASP